MAMTIGDANAAQMLLAELVATAADGYELSTEAMEAGRLIADRSYRVLGAGSNGERWAGDVSQVLTDYVNGYTEGYTEGAIVETVVVKVEDVELDDLVEAHRA